LLTRTFTLADRRVLNPATKGGSGYQSIDQRGLVLTGVKDGTTGEIAMSQNGGAMPDKLAPKSSFAP
jgi:hypothetical protein